MNTMNDPMRAFLGSAAGAVDPYRWDDPTIVPHAAEAVRSGKLSHEQTGDLVDALLLVYGALAQKLEAQMGGSLQHNEWICTARAALVHAADAGQMAPTLDEAEERAVGLHRDITKMPGFAPSLTWWQAELAYIAGEYRHDPLGRLLYAGTTLDRYRDMQARHAERDGFYDIAAQIRALHA